MFTAESDSERILKIGQHLPKLWAINKYRVVFMKRGVQSLYFNLNTRCNIGYSMTFFAVLRQ